MNHRNSCSICGSNAIKDFMSVKDYFLTQESFSIVQCEQCGFKFTNPYPDNSIIHKYYQSTNYLSHPGKSFNAFSFVYNLVKYFNIRSKYKRAVTGYKPGNILDIGCGSGDFLHYCQKKGWSITGIEPDPFARQYCVERLQALVLSPDDTNRIQNESFDIITLWHVLEHVQDLQEQVQTMRKWIKSDGRLVVALPNPDSFDARFYDSYWAGWDVPRHLHHFSKNNIISLMEQNGFRHLYTFPMKWDAFYVSILSQKYMKSKLATIRGVFRGVESNLKAFAGENHSSLIYIFDNQ